MIIRFLLKAKYHDPQTKKFTLGINFEICIIDKVDLTGIRLVRVKGDTFAYKKVSGQWWGSVGTARCRAERQRGMAKEGEGDSERETTAKERERDSERGRRRDHWYVTRVLTVTCGAHRKPTDCLGRSSTYCDLGYRV